MRAYWELPALVLLFVLGVVSGMGSGCQIHQPSPETSVAPLVGPRYVVVKFVGDEIANCWVVNGTVKRDGPNVIVMTYKDGRVVTSIGQEMSFAYLPKPTKVLLEQTYEGLSYFRVNTHYLSRCMR